jgi:DNA-binding XRE family transcriptional regulator/PHD/YefM family antitoxin component YafN of YafNO toxin-antitoxin module
MNKPQTIHTPAGEEMVVLSKADYEALVTAAEDYEDVLLAERSLARIAAGEEELIPDAEMDTYLDAPTPLAFWRKKRGLTQAALAKAAGVTQAHLSETESGKKEARVGVLKELARALKVRVNELIG